MIGAVCHMDAVLIQEKIGSTALHSHYIQKICDPFCNVAGHIGLDTVIDFFFQPVFIVHNAVYREKGSVYRNHGIVPEKFFTENDFVDCFTVKPYRNISGWVLCCFFAHGAVPPFSFVPHSPEEKQSCPPSSSRPPRHPVLPECLRSGCQPDIPCGRASGRLPRNGHPACPPAFWAHTAPSNLPADADNPSAPGSRAFHPPGTGGYGGVLSCVELPRLVPARC